MNVFLYVFAFLRLSTFYAGPVKKIYIKNGVLYNLTSHAVFVENRPVINSQDIFLDFIPSNDTLWILSRHPGDALTYLEAFDKGFHRVYSQEGVKNTSYIEKGVDFWIYANDFYAIMKRGNVSYRLFLSRCHVLGDSLIAGFANVSDTLLILKPLVGPQGIRMDTVFIESGIGFPRDLKVYGHYMYILTRNNQVYVLLCKNSCMLRKLFPDVTESFYYINRVIEDSADRIWLSGYKNTYIFQEGWNDFLILIDSIQGIRVKDVSQMDSIIYVMDYRGHVYNKRLEEELNFPGSIVLLYESNDTLYSILSEHPSFSYIKDPLKISFELIDTLRVRYFVFGDGGVYYLLSNGTLYDATRDSTIMDSVRASFLVQGKDIYFIRNDKLIRFNSEEWRIENEELYSGEIPLFLERYMGNILVFTRDTGMSAIFLHVVDSLLNNETTIEITSNQGFISLLKPYRFGSVVYVPYAYQVSGEYKIARVNIENGLVESVFSGYGFPLSITSFTKDTIYILEMPYGSKDVRLVVADFALMESYLSDYVGTGGGSMVAFDGLLVVGTDGKIDVFDTKLKRMSNNLPVMPINNIVTNKKLLLYSILPHEVEVEIKLFDVQGRSVFEENKVLYKGYNNLDLSCCEGSGLYLLHLKIQDTKNYGVFKLMFIEDDGSR